MFDKYFYVFSSAITLITLWVRILGTQRRNRAFVIFLFSEKIVNIYKKMFKLQKRAKIKVKGYLYVRFLLTALKGFYCKQIITYILISNNTY